MIRFREPTRTCCRRRALTLLESLTAAGLLAAVVVAVLTAITAGQQHAFEAQQRISGTLAAEALMGRIIDDDYAALPTWHGFREEVGAMADFGGNPMPDTFAAIGREAMITTGLESFPGLSVVVGGRTVRVVTFDHDGRTLADLERFVPEPPA